MSKSPCRSCGYPQQSLGPDVSDASVLAACDGAEEELDASGAAAEADGGVAAVPRAAGSSTAGRRRKTSPGSSFTQGAG